MVSMFHVLGHCCRLEMILAGVSTREESMQEGELDWGTRRTWAGPKVKLVRDGRERPRTQG